MCIEWRKRSRLWNAWPGVCKHSGQEIGTTRAGEETLIKRNTVARFAMEPFSTPGEAPMQKLRDTRANIGTQQGHVLIKGRATAAIFAPRQDPDPLRFLQ